MEQNKGKLIIGSDTGRKTWVTRI